MPHWICFEVKQFSCAYARMSNKRHVESSDPVTKECLIEFYIIFI